MRVVTTAVAIAIVVALAGPRALAAPPALLTTVAGGQPTAARAPGISLRPAHVAVTGSGVVYASDPTAGLLWQIRPDGTAGVIAGDGRACARGTSTTNRPCKPVEFGQGMVARGTALQRPGVLTTAPDGTVYVIDHAVHQILRIDSSTGLADLFAGNGTTDYDAGQEGRFAWEIGLNNPQALAAGPDGTLYIGDTGNKLIRQVDSNRRVRTVAGCAASCSLTLRDRAALDKASLSGVTAFAVSPDGVLYAASKTAIYVADQVAGQWRRVAGDTFTAGTVAGQGENGSADHARFADISVLRFGPDGSLFVLDRGWHRLQRIEAPVAATSIIRHVAGAGDAGNPGDHVAARSAAVGMADVDGVRAGFGVDGAGTVFVADTTRNGVRRIDALTNVITTVAGNGIAGPATRIHTPFDFQPARVGGAFSGDGGAADQAQLWGPMDVAVDGAGRLYIADRYANRIRRVDADGTISTVVGAGCAGAGCSTRNDPLGDGGSATAASLYGVTALAFDRTGTQLYIVEQARDRIRQVNLSDAAVTVYPQATAPVVIGPGAIATIVGTGANCVNVTLYCGDGLPATAATLANATGIAVNAAGTIFLADSQQQTIRMVDAADGTIERLGGIPFHSNCESNAVREQDPGLATLLCGPTDMAIGPDGALYVTETGDYGFGSGVLGRQNAPKVRRFTLTDPLWRSTIVAGSGVTGVGGDGGPARQAGLAYPRGIAFAPDGALYIADAGNSRIRRVGTDGVISTVAGLGSWNGDLEGCSLEGDGGPATAAGLCAPSGVAVGPDGTVYVADTLNNSVRALRP